MTNDMSNDELCFLSAVELVRRIKSRALSPVEVMDAVLQRIARINPVINAYCTLAEDQARTQAKAAEAALMHLGITFAEAELRSVADTIRVPGSFELEPRHHVASAIQRARSQAGRRLRR